MMHNNNKRHSHHESKKTIEKRNKNIYRKHERELNNAQPDEDDTQLCDICGDYMGSHAFPVFNEYTGERVPGLFQCGKCLSTHPDD